MRKFRVTYRGHKGNLYHLTIDANNQEEALAKARKELRNSPAKVIGIGYGTPSAEKRVLGK